MKGALVGEVYVAARVSVSFEGGEVVILENWW